MVTADAGIDGRIGLTFATGVEVKIGALEIKVESHRRELLAELKAAPK